ncbi:Nn.00g069270.m01.CDS01 [Neocucurbitaria sp. VM-36]
MSNSRSSKTPPPLTRKKTDEEVKHLSPRDKERRRSGLSACMAAARPEEPRSESPTDQHTSPGKQKLSVANSWGSDAMTKTKTEEPMGALVASDFAYRSGVWTCPDPGCMYPNPTGEQSCEQCGVDLEGKDSRENSTTNKGKGKGINSASASGSWATCSEGTGESVAESYEDVESASGDSQAARGSDPGSADNYRSF